MDFHFLKQVIANPKQDIIWSKYKKYLDQYHYSLESILPHYREVIEGVNNGTIIFTGKDDYNYQIYNSIDFDELDRIINVNDSGVLIIETAENLRNRFYTEFIENEINSLMQEFNTWKANLVDAGNVEQISQELQKISVKLNLYENEIKKIEYLQVYNPIIKQFVSDLRIKTNHLLKNIVVSSQPIYINKDLNTLHSGENLTIPENNKFNSMSIELVRNHFEKLTTTISINGKPHLTNKQIDRFIQIGFLEYDINNSLTEKLTINYGDGEKGTIKRIFYDFYKKCKIEYESTQNVKEKYVKLLTNNFQGFEYKTVSDNFNK